MLIPQLLGGKLIDVWAVHHCKVLLQRLFGIW